MRSVFPSPSVTRIQPRTLAAVGALAALSAVLASCGSTSPTSSSSGTTTTVANARASYQACLKAHGFTFPKYQPSSSAPPSTVPASVRQAAVAACSDLKANIKGSKLSASQRKAFQAYRSCLTSHGVPLPKRTSAPGTPGSGPRRDLVTLSKSPQYAAAAQACASLRPNFSRGGTSVSTTSTTSVNG